MTDRPPGAERAADLALRLDAALGAGIAVHVGPRLPGTLADIV